MFKKCEECNIPQKLNKILYILAAFILVFLFSVVLNDETGLNAERRIKLPILGAELESSDAYIIGPLIIIFLTLCSHLFIQEWYNCEKDQSEKNKCISKVDFIFNDLTCNILFFAITPIILFLFHISSRGKPEKYFTGMTFLAMTSILIILRFLYLKKIRQLIIISGYPQFSSNSVGKQGTDNRRSHLNVGYRL